MRVKKSAVLLLCAALLPLSGCSRAEAALPYAHEIEDTVLMGALGDAGTQIRPALSFSHASNCTRYPLCP